ncbi:peptidase [Nostoc sp. RF31YmG]|jgi:predicted Zn-dependent protease|nr:peptidase [Nostoc sp. RF31YmG]
MGNKIQDPKPNILKNVFTQQLLAVLALAIGTGLLVIFCNTQSSGISTKFQHSDYSISLSLPSPKPHPLPPTLAQWQDNTNSGDYFSQITPTQGGYLVWSQFPIRVYVETPTAINSQQAQVWVNSVLHAVQEWNVYLPLLVVEKPEVADISILRKAPPLKISPNDKIPRARSALTTYELYTNNKVLLHRFTILLSPSQTGNYVIAAARHEFGHALGIWGHSPLQTDALYFSQVRQPPPISPRDVNTLKRVYEQPTSLGWSLVEN